MDNEYIVLVNEELLSLIHIDEWRDGILNMKNEMNLEEDVENKLDAAYAMLSEARQDIIDMVISKSGKQEQQTFFPFNEDSETVACIKREPISETDDYDDDDDIDEWI